MKGGKLDREESPRGKSPSKTTTFGTCDETKEASKGKRPIHCFHYGRSTSGESPLKSNDEEKDHGDDGCLPQGRKYTGRIFLSSYVGILGLEKIQRYFKWEFFLCYHRHSWEVWCISNPHQWRQFLWHHVLWVVWENGLGPNQITSIWRLEPRRNQQNHDLSSRICGIPLAM